jgi:photosystem II stability/assembly factor-like uncharacterized protein
MKQHLLFFTSILLFASCSISKKANPIYPTSDNLSWNEYPVNSSVRAIAILDDNTIWYTGSKGQFGYTENGGEYWTIDSLQFDTFNLEFRSIALVGNSVFILSVASPALLFESKNKGKTWNLVYREDDPKAFYDAMTFWDDQNGIAIGDPTDGCMSVIITRNGGNSWEKLGCDQLPETAEGEAAFAASNTNIVTYKDNAWIVTGGAKARVFRSTDKGMHWSVSDTPIDQGGQMTGIFSVDFYDENSGIIYGGNWENKKEFDKCKAITKDGGKTWDLIKGEPGYMSCVQFIPGTKGNGIIACGSEGLAVSKNGGNSWDSISDKGYYSIRMRDDGTSAWLSGNNKIAFIKWK